jgi:hypothetical protein
MRLLAIAMCFVLILDANLALARGGGGHGGSRSGHSSGRGHSSGHSKGSHSRKERSSKPKATPSAKPHKQAHKSVPDVKRDKHGKIARSSKARNDFKKSHPCPSTGKTSGACPGYVVDHVKALKHGGADAPSNMQWQTTIDAKSKDKWE